MRSRAGHALCLAVTVALVAGAVRRVGAESPFGQPRSPVGGFTNRLPGLSGLYGGGPAATNAASVASNRAMAAIEAPLHSVSGASNLATGHMGALNFTSGIAHHAGPRFNDMARVAAAQQSSSAMAASFGKVDGDQGRTQSHSLNRPSAQLSPLVSLQNSAPVWRATPERLPGLQLLASTPPLAFSSALSDSGGSNKPAAVFPFEGATIRQPSPGLVELDNGSLLVVANGAPVQVSTRLATVNIRKNADVLVKVENGVIRVQNLDAAHSGVQVELLGQKTFAVGPGYELIASDSGLSRETLLPADGVSRRNVVLSTEGTVAVGEIQLAGVIGQQLKQLNQADSGVKQALDRVLKTAAVIHITRGNVGFIPNGLAGAVPPVNVQNPSPGLLPDSVPSGIPPVTRPGSPPLSGGPAEPGSPAANTAGDAAAVSGGSTSGANNTNVFAVSSSAAVSSTFDASRQSIRNALETRSPLVESRDRVGRSRRESVNPAASATPESLKQLVDQRPQQQQPLKRKQDPVEFQEVQDATDGKPVFARHRRGSGVPGTAVDSPAAGAIDQTTPTSEILQTVRESIRAFPELVLFVILLVVSLLLLSLVLARSAMNRAREVESMNKRLEEEVRERRLLEEKATGLNTDLGRRVAELAVLNEELSRARDQALEASQLKSQFVANISHEIRTPISAVIGMNQLLMTSPLEPKQREYARLVNESAQSLLTVINDILDFSKIEAGMIDLHTVPFAAGSVLKEVSDVVSASVRQKGLFFVSAVDEKLPQTLTGDPTRLRQILVNLIGNSVKFTTSGEVVVSAVVVPTRPGYVRFSVQDTGIGISLEAQSKLFQPFVQEDGSTTRRFGGTGLGLSISKRLVELMGGQIMLESTPGIGSHFWCELPLFDPAAAHSSALSETLELPEGASANKSVLVVSGRPHSPHLIKEQLSATGYDVEIASDEDAALMRMYDSQVDVAVIETGTFGGLAEKIRNEEQFNAVSLVGLQTSEAAPGDLYDAWLPTPIIARDVVRWINSLLNQEGFAAVSSPTIAAPTPFAPQAVSNAAVLVAEDSPVLQQMISILFEKLGYTVELVSNGKEAVEAASKGAYSIIFMDWQMPEMDGLEATRIIRRAQTAARTPIIAMTANAMQGDKETCMSAGMDDYISKPFTFEQLKTMVRRWTPDQEAPLC